MAQLDPHQLKERWFEAALGRASIDREHWRPAAGVAQNRATVAAVYRYYGSLFADHPFLLWAGMANMIGPTFYAAFMDIGFLPDVARRLVAAVRGRASRRASREAAGELGFYEDLFLTMQKKIFEDQASMHEAYLAGGVAEIERFYRANIIDLATFGAWQEIDRGRSEGNREPIDNGCRMLLWREQRDIIGRFYETMLHRNPPEGSVFTYVMTLSGAPSIPGAHSQSQVFPLVLSTKALGNTISLTTPLARGNIAQFADRWSLIETDTLPAYLKYLSEHEAKAEEDARVSVAVRAARFRLLAQAGALATAALTRWRLSVGPADVRSDGSPKIDVGEPIVLDVEAPRALEKVGVSSSNRSRVWMSKRGQPLRVEVHLAGRRVYSADADLVAAMSFPVDGRPNHLAVTLPPASLDETKRRVREYAADWGIDPDEVASWERDAGRLTSSGDRTHGTYVLRPPMVGSVQLEFEVAHHVREKEFCTSALFSW